jgi:purine-binding chemotaxis protein CheW
MFRDGVVRLLVFRVGDERFAVPLSDVDEVVEAQPVQRVPDSPPTVLGVASIRGALLTVYDPRPVLMVDGSVDAAMLLFVRGGRRVALAIDDVFDPVMVSERELLPTPSGAESDGIVIGVVRRESTLTAVLDTDALFRAAIDGPEGERERK